MRGGYEWLAGGLRGDMLADRRRRALTASVLPGEATNGHPFRPYVYGGNPPAHKGLCSGCGLLHGACRCHGRQAT